MRKFTVVIGMFQLVLERSEIAFEPSALSPQP